MTVYTTLSSQRYLKSIQTVLQVFHYLIFDCTLLWGEILLLFGVYCSRILVKHFEIIVIQLVKKNVKPHYSVSARNK